MFKTRLITAMVLLPLVILAILKLPTVYVEAISGALFMMAAWEWLAIIGVAHKLARAVSLAILVALAMVIRNAVQQPGQESVLLWVYSVALLWWCSAAIGICKYPKGGTVWRQSWLMALVGPIMLIPAWLAFNQLHGQTMHGPLWVLLGCCLIWGADTGAYCFGKLWGKEKLIEAVSPGKTWAGFYGAVVTGGVISGLFYWGLKPDFGFVMMLSSSFNAFTMPRHTRQKALLRPTAVSVHNNGNVPRYY